MHKIRNSYKVEWVGEQKFIKNYLKLDTKITIVIIEK